MEVLDIEIRKQLARYLAGEIALSGFQDWFVPRAWNVDKRGDHYVAQLVHSIELKFAEYSSGHWTEDELKQTLRPLLTNYTVRMSAAPHMDSVTHSAAHVKEFQVVYPGAVVGIQSVRVSS